MDSPDEQEIRIEKDIRYLTRTVKPDDLKAEVMFAKERGIRSCTPPFDKTTANTTTVQERLKRVQPPKEE
jgi:hypothetical protein